MAPRFPPEICWIFSLARCGSSVIAYAAAAPWALPVADEPFGPWDRTGPPYHYPPEQKVLKERFWESGEHLTPEVLGLAERVFDGIAKDSARLIVKHPHDMIRPEEFRTELPHHRSVFLLRHPLKRLNSLYARGWHKSIGPNFDLDRFSLVARRWLEHPHRLTFEQFRADPRAFFARLWIAFGWAFDESHLDVAVAYQQSHYHDSSAKLSDERPDAVVSEGRWCVPPEAEAAYAADPFVQEVMRRAGWSDTAQSP
ncbi:MAG: hypothetical protein IT439_06715 [Phycisphaerales bacterium]|nr:hypothetical protein [Phycisphaerales bacterium]